MDNFRQITYDLDSKTLSNSNSQRLGTVSIWLKTVRNSQEVEQTSLILNKLLTWLKLVTKIWTLTYRDEEKREQALKDEENQRNAQLEEQRKIEMQQAALESAKALEQ